MLRKFFYLLLVALVVLITYLGFAPIPAKPEIWHAPTPPGYVGVHAVNQKLAQLKQIDLLGNSGPEHVAQGADGAIYLAVEGGKILRMQADGSGLGEWAQTGGRVLGFAFAENGDMIAADAMRGLLKIRAASKENPTQAASVEVLLDHTLQAGVSQPIEYANSVVVAKSGKIYFTDASMHFGAKAWGSTFLASVYDILEHAATGRVIEYDPVTKQSHVIMQDLSFANGLALSADENALFVVETGAYRVWKLNLHAASTAGQVISAKVAATSKTPQAQIFLSNLPGFPDNLMRGLDGKIWLGLAKPRSGLIDKLADKPFWRGVTLRLPQALWPVPPAYGHVLAFDETGKIVTDLQDPTGAYPQTTGVLETADRLYIQSLHAHSLGWMNKPVQ